MQNGYGHLDIPSSDDEDGPPMDPRKGESTMVYMGDVQQASHTLERLNTLRKSGQFCDVSIEVDGSSLNAHRAVLAAESSFLFELFSAHDAGVEHFKLDNVDFESFQLLVNFIYTFRLEIPTDHVRSVYKAAMLMKMPIAASACSKHMAKNLTPDNCLGTRSFANSYSDLELTSQTDAFIQENFDLVAKSMDFQQLKPLRLDILGLSEVQMDGNDGEHLVELSMEWVKACVLESDIDLEELSAHLHKLFLGVDNTLRDCGDVEDRTFSNIEEVQDYKQLNKKRQIANKMHIATGLVKEKGSISPPPHAGNRCQSLDRLSAVVKEWKIIALKCVSDRCMMAITMFHDVMFRLSLNFHTVPEACSIPPDGDGEHSPNSSSPRSSIAGDKVVSLTPLARMSTPRSAAGTGVVNGKLVCMGGYDRGECLSTMESYDMATNTWLPMPSMRSPRGRFDVSQYQGALYACGGSNGSHELRSSEYFDMAKQEWKPLPDMISNRASAGVIIVDGKLYAIGGWAGQRGMADCEMYDLTEVNAKWRRIPPMSTGRSETGVCHLGNQLIAVGGCDAWSCTNTVEAYVPAENRWYNLPPMKMNRRGAGVALFKGKLYVIGGSDGTSVQNTTEIYDPTTKTWSTGPNITVPRANVSCVVLGGRLYAVGGFSGKTFLDTIEFLGADANEWCTYVPIEAAEPAVNGGEPVL